MIKILSFLFPCIRRLVEISKNQKKLISLHESKKPEYVYIQPVDRTSPEFVSDIGNLYANHSFLWLVDSLIKDITKNMVNDIDEKAASYKNQIVGVKSLIAAMEYYERALNDKVSEY